MIKRLLKINLVLFLSAMIMAGDASAFFINPISMDFLKSGSKVSEWVSKQKENFQHGMERISETSFGHIIGDGIKNSKKAVKFFKDQVANIKDAKKAFKESMAYKIALKNKEIIKETKRLNDIRLDEQKSIQEVENKTQVKIEAVQQKISIAQENAATSAEIYNKQIKEASNDEARTRSLKEEKQSFESGVSLEVASLNKEIPSIQKDAEKEKNGIRAEFVSRVADQGQLIAKLTKELKEMTNKQNDQNNETPSTEEIAKTDTKMFIFEKGKEKTLKAIKTKADNIRLRKKSNTVKAMNTSTSTMNKLTDTKEDQELLASFASVQPGKSDATQTQVLDTANQLVALKDYLMIELENLENKAISLVSQEESYETSFDDIVTVFDICDYLPKQESIFNSIKSEINKASEAYQKGKSQVNDVTQGIADVKQSM